MFDAFRCGGSQQLGTRPAASGASLAAALSSPAKRRKKDAGGTAAAASAAAAQAPGGGGGLALEKMGDQPLRCVIVGHNPSDHAWASGHFYSNPSNHMWRILRETGIAPPDRIAGAADDGAMPEVAGVGFTDVGSGTPGTDSSQFGASDWARWRPGFYARLQAQAGRAARSIGCSCGTCGAPAVVAFSGKTQFAQLFLESGGGGRGRKAAVAAAVAAGPAAAVAASQANASSSGPSEPQERVPSLQARRPSSITPGRQWELPDGWPLPLSTEVWVMTSTSGAAGLTRQQRYAPWEALAERLQREPWPHRRVPCCAGGSSAAAAAAVPAAAGGSEGSGGACSAGSG